MKKLLVPLIMMLPIITWAQGKEKSYDNALPSGLRGNWKVAKDCQGEICFSIEQWNPIVVAMNNGKVKFNARAIPNPNNPDQLQLFLMEPDNDDENMDDSVLHWHNFSLDKPIADLRYSASEDNIRVSWKGFYDKTTKKYVYKNEPEWKNTKPRGALYRCATAE